jgi:hypothetical protein
VVGKSIRPLVVSRAVCSIALLCVVGCSGQDPDAKRTGSGKPARLVITAEQAVRFAEAFIRANGYTNDPAEDQSDMDVDADDPEVTNEEDEQSPIVVLAERRNTIKPRAYGWMRGRRNDPKGWTVGFELVKPLKNDPSIGQAVEMDDHGSEIWLEHVGFDLKSLPNKL